MEQPHVPAAAAVAIASLGRALSDEARASLEAVRVAQEAARLRARRQTTQARIWLIALLGAGALAAVTVGPRVARWRQARAQAGGPARTSLIAAAPAAPAAKAPAVEPNKPEPPVTAGSAAPVAALAPLAASQDTARDVAGTGADEGCDTALIRTAPWRLSPPACARLFESDPTNASLALAIAHAEHGNSRFAEAAQWAKRALALDANAAEAHVMIARADMKDGRRDDGLTSYRRYLELAPRGWHAAEARAAVRRARTAAPLDAARNR
jgi:tetratricopeptide (TPR) repeat protein